MIALGITACSNRKPEKSKDVVQPINPEKNAPGDKMVYGLACEGCTDSVIVFLPNSGGDPVTFDILDAMRNHKVYGRPKIGDTVALLMDKEEKNLNYNKYRLLQEYSALLPSPQPQYLAPFEF